MFFLHNIKDDCSVYKQLEANYAGGISNLNIYEAHNVDRAPIYVAHYVCITYIVCTACMWTGPCTMYYENSIPAMYEDRAVMEDLISVVKFNPD
jgi:hypothetical protein